MPSKFAPLPFLLMMGAVWEAQAETGRPILFPTPIRPMVSVLAPGLTPRTIISVALCYPMPQQFAPVMVPVPQSMPSPGMPPALPGTWVPPLPMGVPLPAPLMRLPAMPVPIQVIPPAALYQAFPPGWAVRPGLYSDGAPMVPAPALPLPYPLVVAMRWLDPAPMHALAPVQHLPPGPAAQLADRPAVVGIGTPYRDVSATEALTPPNPPSPAASVTSNTVQPEEPSASHVPARPQMVGIGSARATATTAGTGTAPVDAMSSQTLATSGPPDSVGSPTAPSKLGLSVSASKSEPEPCGQRTRRSKSHVHAPKPAIKAAWHRRKAAFSPCGNDGKPGEQMVRATHMHAEAARSNLIRTKIRRACFRNGQLKDC